MANALRVLLVEDSPDDAALVLRQLRRGGYNVTSQLVDTTDAMAAALDGRAWDVVIADYSLPSFSGLAALALLTQRGLDLPFLIVSGNIGEDVAVAAMKAGAHDYILKGSLARLLPAVEREMREAEGRRSRRRAEAERDRFFSLGLDLMVVAGFDGYFKRVNPACEQALGWTAAELTAHPWLHFVHPDDHAPTVAEADQLFRGVETVCFENRYRRRDGSYRWISWKVRPILDERTLYCAGTDVTERKRSERELRNAHEELEARVGERTRALALANEAMQAEVAERKRSEAALRASEAFVRRVLESSPDCIKVLDRDGRLVSMSDNGCRLMEIDDIGPCLNTDWVGFWQGADREAARAAVDAARAGRMGTFGGACPTAKGTPKWWDVRVTPIVADDGDVEQLLAISRDVTEQRRAEEARRVSEEQLRAILDNTTAAVYVKDLSGSYLMVNRRVEALMGLPREAFLGKTDYDLLPKELAGAMAANDRRVIETGQAVEFEEVVPYADGQDRAYISTKFPLRDAAGEIYAVCGVSTDITERKRAEAAAGAARDAAVAASEAKSRFLATMSHEIRTPLNGVVGMTDLLLGTGLNEQQRRYALLAKSSAESLTAVITDILDFSKIEAGKLELECVDFDLHLAVEDVMGMLGQKASHKGLELACHISPQVPTLVRGDPDRLRQVVINLLNNAIKFTEAGAVVISVTPDATPPDGGGGGGGDVSVRFAVTDTGVGIPPDRLDRLFKAFSQVDASTTRRFGGTGLGLAICRQLAELMGGRVGVESEVGRGSTFWFTAKLQTQPGNVLPPRQQYGDLRGLRVLAVAESAPHREVLRRQLADWGCDARTADDAGQARRAVEQAAAAGEPFDLAILDLDTPGMNGIELGDAIHRAPASKDVRLLLLSPMESEADLSLLRAVGFAGSVSKPVRQSQLFDTLMSAAGAAGTGLPAAVTDLAPGAGIGDTFDAEGPPQQQQQQRPRRLRVLVAEDNRVNQIVATEMLSRLGHACDVVDEGSKAVQALQNGSYDLVLMDCEMPGMDGFDTTRAIRRAERDGQVAGDRARHVPIVALTANAIKGDRERCLAAGMDGYVSKPIDQGRLRDAIAAAIREFPVEKSDRDAPRFEPAAAGVSEGPSATSSAEPGTAPPFDVDVLLERCMGSADTVRLILDEFQKQAASDLQQLEQGVHGGDHERTRRVAHTLKGAAGILSAHKLCAAAARLEHLARAGSLGDAAGCLEQLRSEVEGCLAYFPTGRQLLARRESAGR